MIKQITKLYSPKWVTRLLPAAVIIIWFVIASIGGPTFGKLSGVSSNDQASFLPASADSTKVQSLQQKFYSNKTFPAIVVIKLSSPAQLADFNKFNEIKQSLSTVEGVYKGPNAVVGPIPSKDHQAIEYIVQVNTSSTINVVVQNMRTILNKQIPSGAVAYVTGPAGLSADLINGFSGIDGILIYVALISVFIILLVVYKSIFLPILVLLSAIFALSGAILVVYVLASHNVIKLNGQSQGILSILVIGAATDYSLLMIARFREALGHTSSKWEAIKEAYKYSFEPIAASAATVILALICLLFSDLNSNRSLGPIAALGIAFAFLVAVTLLPAFLVIFGRFAFWPFKPKLHPLSSEMKYKSLKTGVEDRNGTWRAVPEFVARRYRSIWIILTIILIGFSFGLTQLKASGVSEAATIIGKSNAVDGQTVQAKHFPAGSGSPAVIVTPKEGSEKVLQVVKSAYGISSSSFYVGNTSSGNPKEVNGMVLINATLIYNPDSKDAENVVANLRQILKSTAPDAIVGGATAINLDTHNTSNSDLKKIIPIVLVVILIVLIILLRALLAPILLILTVILSFAASLGFAALVFNHVFHFPGSDSSVPLFGFIFLVALGIDYNIFLMSRVREETKKLGTRPGILRGLSLTGGVITSAGIVLASTFAALAVIPILFLVEIAFIVSFGVLIDSILVRSLVVPAISYDISSAIWWPSKLWRKK
jgi:RND superfamily putative drug exporter